MFTNYENITNGLCELSSFLTKIGASFDDKNISLFVQNFNSIFPELKKLDPGREYFTHNLEFELTDVSNSVLGPFKKSKSCSHKSQIFNLLTQLSIDELTIELRILSAIFIYAQFNMTLFSSLPTCPSVISNQLAMRRFICNANAKSNDLNGYYDNEIQEINDIEYLLDAYINNSDRFSKTHHTTSKLMHNMLAVITSSGSLLTVNVSSQKKPYIQKSKRGHHPNTINYLQGDSEHVLPISKNIFLEKNSMEASSPWVIEIYESAETDIFVQKNELRRFTQTKSIIENNYPQNHQRVLTNKEAAVFYQKFLLEFSLAIEDEQKKAIAGMIFMLLLGMDSSWLSDITLIDDMSNRKATCSNKIYISTDGYVRFRAIELPHSYKPAPVHREFLTSTESQIITLPLPLSLLPVNSELRQIILNESLIVDKKVFQREFNKIREKLSRRLTNDKMREFTFNLYYRMSNNDEVMATLLKPASPYRIPSCCYYSSISLNQLQKLHQNSFEKVFGQLTPIHHDIKDVFIGSKLCVDKNKVREWLENLAINVESSLKNARTLDQLIFAHNNYVLYVTTVLLLTTGHRPVNDMFDSRNCFFINEMFAVVGDKAVDSNHSIRLVPLCNTAKLQLTKYLVHLDNFSCRLNKFDNDAARKIKGLIKPNKKQTLPFLSTLSINKKGGIIFNGVNKTAIDDFWHKLPLPTNFYRHLLCSTFRENGISREIINFFMGHHLIGQNILGYHSPIKPKLILNLLGIAIEKITVELNIKPMKGLSDSKHDGRKQIEKHNDITPIFPQFGPIGIAKRAIRRKNKVNDAQKFVDSYINENLPDFYTNNSQPITDAALNQARDNFGQEKNISKSLVFDIFQKKLNKRAKKGNRKQERITCINSDYEKSALSQNFALKSQQYIVLRGAIKQVAIEVITSKKNASLTFTDKLAVLHLWVLVSNLPYCIAPVDFYHLTDIPQRF